MATFEEAIVAILKTDGQDTTSGRLGNLCSYNASTKPNVVFHGFPPENIATPLVTYRINSEEGYFPRNIFLDILVWGGNLKAIHNRIYDLLHKRLEITATDWVIKGLLYESSGPVIYDDTLKVQFQRARFRAVTLRA